MLSYVDRVKQRQETRDLINRQWGGRTYKCQITGETYTFPDDGSLYYGQFVQFGESYLDLGDGVYFRAGGSPVEVLEELE